MKISQFIEDNFWFILIILCLIGIPSINCVMDNVKDNAKLERIKEIKVILENNNLSAETRSSLEKQLIESIK